MGEVRHALGPARVLPLTRLRRALLGGLILGAASHAAAHGNSPHNLEQHIEALKYEFFTLQHQRVREQLAARYATVPYLNVFIAQNLDGWVMESAELSLNGEVVAQTSYTPRQARALLRGGWHRFLRRGIDSEEYVLEARLRGRFAGSEDPVDLLYSLVFEAVGEHVEVLLAVGERERVVTSAQRGASVPISIVHYEPMAEPARVLQRDCRAPLLFDAGAAHARASAPGPDTCFAVAQFLLDIGRSQQALHELQLLSARSGDARSWLLGRSYLQLGMPMAAERAFNAISVDDPHFVQAMFLLAEVEYERGAPQRALQRLLRHEGRVPDGLRLDWQDLLTRVLIQTGDAAQAVERLSGLRSRDMTQYMRYNLGVALLQSGEIDNGITLLRHVGRSRAGSESEAVLHDRALLVAAQHAMDKGHHARARALLRDVRLNGPYSNPAMLAMGWAHLTDTSLAIEAPGPSEAALRLWSELVEQDPMDPAVQEAMVGIPYLLSLKEQSAAAHRAYLLAISALDAAARLMDEGIDSLYDNRLIDTLASTGDGRALGRDWQVEGLPDMPATYWLPMELSGPAFQEGLRNYRDLGIMIRRLNAWSGARHAPLVERMQQARERQAEVLRAQGLGPLKGRRAIIAEHLARARLGIARIEERAVLGRN